MVLLVPAWVRQLVNTTAGNFALLVRFETEAGREA